MRGRSTHACSAALFRAADASRGPVSRNLTIRAASSSATPSAVSAASASVSRDATRPSRAGTAVTRQSLCQSRIDGRVGGIGASWRVSKGRNSRAFASSSSKYPEHRVLNLPAMSPTMENGTIAKWHKKVGDKVNSGDFLAEIETDKATVGFDISEDGYVAKLFYEEGTKDVPVGKPIAILVDEEGDVAAFANMTAAEVGGGAAAPGPASAKAPAPSTPSPSAPTAAATPAAPTKSYPPHLVVPLPALSPTMSTGNIGTWKKQPGDKITAGDPLVEIETDKATMDFESSEDGILAKILVPSGTKDVPTGEPICVIVEDASAVPEFADFVVPTAATAAPKAAAAPSAPAPSAPSAPTPSAAGPVDLKAAGMPHLTPAVWHLVVDNNLDPRQIKATGKSPSGKQLLTKGDVLAYVEGVKSGAIKAAPGASKAAPVAAKAAAPKKEGSGKAGEYSRILDVSKLEEMRDALNEKFGTALSTQSLLFMAAMRAVHGTSLDTGSAAVVKGSSVSPVANAGHMGADDLSRILGALPPAAKADGGIGIATDAAEPPAVPSGLSALLSFTPVTKGRSPTASSPSGITFSSNPLSDILGPNKLPQHPFESQPPPETDADAQLEHAVRQFISGKFKPAPLFDASEMAGLKPGKHAKKGIVVKATLKVDGTVATEDAEKVIQGLGVVESGAGLML